MKKISITLKKHSAMKTFDLDNHMIYGSQPEGELLYGITRCPICLDYFDEFGIEVLNPRHSELGTECEECKAYGVYISLTSQDCESFENLYNLQRHYPEYIAKFWVWMAETLKVEIHIAKRVITLIEEDK